MSLKLDPLGIRVTGTLVKIQNELFVRVDQDDVKNGGFEAELIKQQRPGPGEEVELLIRVGKKAIKPDMAQQLLDHKVEVAIRKMTDDSYAARPKSLTAVTVAEMRFAA